MCVCVVWTDLSHKKTIKKYGTDPTGPAHWGPPKFKTCESAGTRQSPINITVASLDSLVTCNKVPLLYDYQPIENAVVHWNGRTVEVVWPRNELTAHNNSIVIRAQTYDLVQMHFYTPSEHRINNRHADAELQLVHQAADGKIAMVAVLLKAQYVNMSLFSWITELNAKVDESFDPLGEFSPAESKGTADEGNEPKKDVKEGEPEAEKEDEEEDEDEDEDESEANAKEQEKETEGTRAQEKLKTRALPSDDAICTGKEATPDDAKTIEISLPSLDLSPLLKAIGKFSPRWEYQGSMITPPCTGHVAWNVMHNTFPIGIEQLHALVDLQGYNARPIQELKKV